MGRSRVCGKGTQEEIQVQAREPVFKRVNCKKNQKESKRSHSDTISSYSFVYSGVFRSAISKLHAGGFPDLLSLRLVLPGLVSCPWML